MKKPTEVSLSVTFFKEGKVFVAYSPALDISTVGKSLKEVKANFEELTNLFFEETENRGTTEDALLSLGWQKTESRQWQPPVEVEHSIQKVLVPA